MHHIFTASNGEYLWRGDIDTDLMVCNIFVEWKIPHPYFPQIRCGASAHVFRLDKTGMTVFHDKFMPFFPEGDFLDFLRKSDFPYRP